MDLRVKFVYVKKGEREILGRLGFKSTVNCTDIKELSLSLVANTALESPTFPTMRSCP